jgi:predicted chitinase
MAKPQQPGSGTRRAVRAARPSGFAPVPITAELLFAAEHGNSLDYYGAITGAMNACAQAYLVDSPLRVAHFLAQIGHESGFRAVEENGNYSARRMREIFGCKGGPSQYDRNADDCRLGPDGAPARLRQKLWTEQARYANNAFNLLSYVYANRLGNGDEASGDGYRYRGRGLIQLTGKANYQDFTDSHNRRNPDDHCDFVSNPTLMMDIKYAIESAFYYWDARNVNEAADADDVEEVTRRVNGGLNGLADREARLARIKLAMGI